MTYQGWQTELVLWRESSLGGSKTGDAMRPPGLTDVRLDRVNSVQHAQVGAHGEQSKLEALHWSWTLTITREFSFNAWLNMLLEAIRTDPLQVETNQPATGYKTTTRKTRLDAATPSFGGDFALGDGQFFRLTGMSPRRINWSFSAGRVCMETVEFAVLSAVAIAEGDMTDPDVAELHEPVAGILVDLSMKVGAGAAVTTTAFTGEIIVDRDVEPCQHNEEGIPTRLAATSNWRGTGQGICRLGTDAGTLTYGSINDGTLTWRVEHPGDPLMALSLNVPSARFSMRALPVVTSDFLSHSLEWMALSGGGPILNTIRIEPL